GWRILRLYVNIHPTASRVWATSETFGKLFEQYGVAAGLPHAFTEGWTVRLQEGLLRLFQPAKSNRSDYDRFMLRFHHFLKTSDHFQERAPRKLWHFAPGTAWLAFTDALSHADLRGRYALEHSFFISPDALSHPEIAPAAILQKACGMPVLPSAA
ncbi:MAG: Kdo hydroxylase family protein, partial [Acidobacteriales bacterium]|nr:Kdo hydroxylase family protein [Terriglobales bacterium]